MPPTAIEAISTEHAHTGWRIKADPSHPVSLRVGSVEHSLTVAQVAEILRNAPQVALAWEPDSQDGDFRRVNEHGDEIAYVGAADDSGRPCWVLAFSIRSRFKPGSGTTATLDEAKVAADAALIAAGWVLV
jgi:hypothetical protein